MIYDDLAKPPKDHTSPMNDDPTNFYTLREPEQPVGSRTSAGEDGSK